MNNKQRKCLYESILKDVAKIVKKRIDEAEDKENVLNEEGDELVEWESAGDITYEQFYDPKLNASFSNINDDFIFYDDSTKQIGIAANIEDRNGDGGAKDFEIWADSFGKVLEYFDIAVEASTEDLHEKFFKITTNQVISRFWKAWRRTLNNDEVSDKLEDNIDDFYANVFEPAQTIDDVIAGITNMQY